MIILALQRSTSLPSLESALLAAGGQWQSALAIFNSMTELGLKRDAITYSSLISALAKGKQWVIALKVRCISARLRYATGLR